MTPAQLSLDMKLLTLLTKNLNCLHLEVVVAKRNGAGGTRTNMKEMAVFGIIPAHILNRQRHPIYQTHRNACRRIMMDEIVQCTVIRAKQNDGVKG